MTIEQKNFASRLASSTESHADWLSVMNFGMETLIAEPAMLAELLCAEAIRMAKKTPTHNAADELPKIMKELGLRFVVGRTPKLWRHSAKNPKHLLNMETKIGATEPSPDNRAAECRPPAHGCALVAECLNDGQVMWKWWAEMWRSSPAYGSGQKDIHPKHAQVIAMFDQAKIDLENIRETALWALAQAYAYREHAHDPDGAYARDLELATRALNRHND